MLDLECAKNRSAAKPENIDLFDRSKSGVVIVKG
jgi:hypothetical protein